MRNFRLVHLARDVSPTAMFWNDMVPFLAKKYPGLSYPAVVVAPRIRGASRKSERSSGHARRYYQCGVLGAVCLLRTLSRRNRESLIVHVHMPVLAVVMVLLRFAGCRVKTVVTQHNTWARFLPHQKVCLWALTFLADHYVVCSAGALAGMPNSVKQRLERRGRLSVITNGIPAAGLTAWAARRARYLKSRQSAPEKCQTTIVARMGPQKNGIQLLRMITAVPELGDVTWYGDGEMRSALHEERARLGLIDRVTFAGKVSREAIYDALAHSDFYMTMSLWEGLSVADLEAVAIGCFPLMSDIPQRHNIASAGGFDLLPVGDQGVWREKARKYLGMSADEKADFGWHTSMRICEAFSLDRMIRRYAAVYSEVGSKRV